MCTSTVRTTSGVRSGPQYNVASPPRTPAVTVRCAIGKPRVGRKARPGASRGQVSPGLRPLLHHDFQVPLPRRGSWSGSPRSGSEHTPSPASQPQPGRPPRTLARIVTSLLDPESGIATGSALEHYHDPRAVTCEWPGQILYQRGGGRSRHDTKRLKPPAALPTVRQRGLAASAAGTAS